jgi:hypothetical protein
MSLQVGIDAAAPFSRRVRIYFAPVNRAGGVPAIFDAAVSGGFNLASPPQPWIDLGWIEAFTRNSASTIGTVATGSPSTVLTQVRQHLEAHVSFRFQRWGKVQMAVASGSQHMNLLSPGTAAVPVAAASTPALISLTASDAAQFSAGQMVVVDADYTGQTGYVGSPVSAAYVRSAMSVNNDPNYIRRVSFNVARVAATMTGGLTLSEPLIGGAPSTSLKVQQILGFVDREGGSFFQEWSALFVLPGEQGERVFYYYPRLQAMTAAHEFMQPLAGTLEQVCLSAQFRSMPVTDSTDGEVVVCYRSFLPSPMALI